VRAGSCAADQLKRVCRLPDVCRFYLGLGEKDQALLLLQKAYEERFDPVILTWPAFDPVRSDPIDVGLLTTNDGAMSKRLI
jgi:hypothetical protein